MWTTAGRDEILGLLSSHYAALLKSITDWRAGTVVEADYTGYDAGARPAIGPGSPAGTSPAGGRQVANGSTVAFPQNTGTNQDVIAVGWYSAASGGTLKLISLLDTDPPILGTITTADLITAPAHGLVADQRVFVMAAPGAVLPAELSENTAYYVLAAGLTTDAFAISTSSGGSAVDVSTSGAALFIPYKPVTIATNATPSFGAGTLIAQV